MTAFSCCGGSGIHELGCSQGKVPQEMADAFEACERRLETARASVARTAIRLKHEKGDDYARTDDGIMAMYLSGEFDDALVVQAVMDALGEKRP